jgi:hypothetical protein
MQVGTPGFIPFRVRPSYSDHNVVAMGQNLTCKGYADGRIAGRKNPDTGHIVKGKVGRGTT